MCEPMRHNLSFPLHQLCHRMFQLLPIHFVHFVHSQKQQVAPPPFATTAIDSIFAYAFCARFRLKNAHPRDANEITPRGTPTPAPIAAS